MNYCRRPVVAQVSVDYNGQLIQEICESKMWDVAFLNALDQVQEKMKQIVIDE